MVGKDLSLSLSPVSPFKVAGRGKSILGRRISIFSLSMPRILPDEKAMFCFVRLAKNILKMLLSIYTFRSRTKALFENVRGWLKMLISIHTLRSKQRLFWRMLWEGTILVLVVLPENICMRSVCKRMTYCANNVITGHFVIPPRGLHHRHLLIHLLARHHKLFQVLEEIFVRYMVLKCGENYQQDYF